MRSFRRLACVLALTLPVLPAAFGQVSSSSSSTQAQPPSGETQGEVTVQARIRQRREQRRQAAIRAAYDHLYDAYGGVGYLRFSPGKYLQQLTFYAWDFGITRYSSERLGINLEGRGYFGTAYVGLNKYGLTRPAISQYDVLAGPSYRVYVQPKYSVALRAMGGWSYGNFSGDTNGLGGTTLSSSVAAVYSLPQRKTKPPLKPRLACNVDPKPVRKYSGARRRANLGETLYSPRTLASMAKLLPSG